MINIPDTDFKQIMSVMGYPIVTLDDLGIEREDIDDTIIAPAMYYYFTWFPKISEETFEIGTYFDIDYPRNTIFTAIDVRINPNMRIGGARSQSPLVNEFQVRYGGTGRKRMWGTDNDYGYIYVKKYEELERVASVNSIKTFNYNVNDTTRKVTGYSSTFGTLQVKWAEQSLDWSEIPLYRKKDALEICQIYLLEFFGNLRNQAINGIPVEMTGEPLLQRASEMRERLETRWKGMSKIKIIRA